MSQPRVLILRAPGTNCDQEAAFAFQQAGATTESLHINHLLRQPETLRQFQILCIPGGFSYGDDVAAGRILGNLFQHHLGEEMARFKADGKLILGICNGFQVLIKSGVLLEPDAQLGPPATLTWNDSGRFEDRWVRLESLPAHCVFLQGIEAMYLPVAHAEGKFVVREPGVLEELDRKGQLVLRYRPLSGDGKADHGEPAPYPDNPNGSVANVAGICDASGRVLGLMPHPERHIDPTQHPRWTRGEAAAVGDGLKVFQNAVGYFR
jgi:phosphoribosylformylglycinamidine synthase